MRPLLASLILIAAALAPGAAAAQDSNPSSFTITIENDRFANTDHDYTHGTRIAHQWGHAPGRGWAPRLAGELPLLDPGGRLRSGLAIGQNIYTPTDTDRSDPIPGDRPYAGWLYLALSLSSATSERMDSVALELGVVGPAAGAEQVQNTFHHLINVNRSRGWDNQLGDEPGLNLVVERRWKRLYPLGDQLWLDMIPYAGGSLGNVLTYAGAGGMVRFGFNLPDDFGPAHIRPSIAGSDSFGWTDGVGWYLFAGAEASYVVHNLFLDGNTFRDSPAVDRIPVVADFQAGIAVSWQWLRLSYAQLLRSPEFEGQQGFDGFGSISLSIRY